MIYPLVVCGLVLMVLIRCRYAPIRIWDMGGKEPGLLPNIQASKPGQNERKTLRVPAKREGEHDLSREERERVWVRVWATYCGRALRRWSS